MWPNKNESIIKIDANPLFNRMLGIASPPQLDTKQDMESTIITTTIRDMCQMIVNDAQTRLNQRHHLQSRVALFWPRVGLYLVPLCHIVRTSAYSRLLIVSEFPSFEIQTVDGIEGWMRCDWPLHVGIGRKILSLCPEYMKENDGNSSISGCTKGTMCKFIHLSNTVVEKALLVLSNTSHSGQYLIKLTLKKTLPTTDIYIGAIPTKSNMLKSRSHNNPAKLHLCQMHLLQIQNRNNGKPVRSDNNDSYGKNDDDDGDNDYCVLGSNCPLVHLDIKQRRQPCSKTDILLNMCITDPQCMLISFM
jgi:hypothetical protein